MKRKHDDGDEQIFDTLPILPLALKPTFPFNFKAPPNPYYLVSELTEENQKLVYEHFAESSSDDFGSCDVFLDKWRRLAVCAVICFQKKTGKTLFPEATTLIADFLFPSKAEYLIRETTLYDLPITIISYGWCGKHDVCHIWYNSHEPDSKSTDLRCPCNAAIVLLDHNIDTPRPDFVRFLRPPLEIKEKSGRIINVNIKEVSVLEFTEQAKLIWQFVGIHTADGFPTPLSLMKSC